MSDRDVIAETISAHTTMTVSSWPPTLHCRCGWGIQAKGWNARAAAHAEHLADQIGDALRESRTVRTVEELDALPVGSIAVEPVGHAWIKHDPALWHCSCDGTDVEWASSLLVQDSHLPLQIVHRPDEDGAL